MEAYTVTIVHLETNTESQIAICADEAETSDEIILTASVDGKKLCASDYNYLPAYQKLRDALLRMHYGIKCNGSRINAVQSDMMGANAQIYLVKYGQCALQKDIVSLYAYADINSFPDTKQQNDYFEQWSASV